MRFAFFLIFVLLLTGCGSTDLALSPYIPANTGELLLYTEQTVYPTDTERIQLVLENIGDMQIVYGLEWHMEVLREGEWYILPFAEGAAWIDIGCELLPGRKDLIEVEMDMLDYPFRAGEYRILKQVNGTMYSAEFVLE